MTLRSAILILLLVFGLAGAGWAQTQSSGPVIPQQAPSPQPGQVQMAPATQPGANPLAEGDDIRDVRTVELAVPSDYQLWYILAAVAAALLVGLGVYWNLRHRKIKLLPHQQALLELEEARNQAQPGQGREYAYSVSEIVRQYIEKRFNARAKHRTTEEFLYDLLQNPNAALAGYTDSLKEFLEGCDLAKFAGVELDQEGIDRFHITALNFIRATAPRKEGDPEPVLQDMPEAAAEPQATDAPEPVPEPMAASEAPAEEISLEEPEEAEPAPSRPAAETRPEENGDGDHPDSRYLPK